MLPAHNFSRANQKCAVVLANNDTDSKRKTPGDVIDLERVCRVEQQ